MIILALVQFMIGASIVLGGVLLSAFVTHERRSNVRKYVLSTMMAGLVMWGMWLACIGFCGGHDSPPAMAFAACVAYILLKHGRLIRGILDGEYTHLMKG